MQAQMREASSVIQMSADTSKGSLRSECAKHRWCEGLEGEPSVVSMNSVIASTVASSGTVTKCRLPQCTKSCIVRGNVDDFLFLAERSGVTFNTFIVMG